jgi:hypothetical protein
LGASLFQLAGSLGHTLIAAAAATHDRAHCFQRISKRAGRAQRPGVHLAAALGEHLRAPLGMALFAVENLHSIVAVQGRYLSLSLVASAFDE